MNCIWEGEEGGRWWGRGDTPEAIEKGERSSTCNTRRGCRESRTVTMDLSPFASCHVSGVWLLVGVTLIGCLQSYLL